MFKEIEKTYKEKSEFNIVTRISFKIYWVIVTSMWIFGIKNYTWFSFLIILVMIIIMVCLTLSRLKLKIVFNNKDNKCEVHSLKYFFHKQEYELMKNYVLNNDMMNVEVIKNIIYHYRRLIPINVQYGNFIALFTLLITILFSIIDEDGLKIDIINKILPFILTFLLIYGSYKLIYIFTKTIKGESGMYERLEEIFSELLVEASNNEIGKVNKRKINNKVKNKKI